MELSSQLETFGGGELRTEFLNVEEELWPYKHADWESRFPGLLHKQPLYQYSKLSEDQKPLFEGWLPWIQQTKKILDQEPPQPSGLTEESLHIWNEFSRKHKLMVRGYNQ